MSAARWPGYIHQAVLFRRNSLLLRAAHPFTGRLALTYLGLSACMLEFNQSRHKVIHIGRIKPGRCIEPDLLVAARLKRPSEKSCNTEGLACRAQLAGPDRAEIEYRQNAYHGFHRRPDGVLVLSSSLG